MLIKQTNMVQPASQNLEVKNQTFKIKIIHIFHNPLFSQINL